MTNILPEEIRTMGRVCEDEPLSSWTTFRLGGPCRALVSYPTSERMEKACRALRRSGVPYVLLGGGSNVLAADEGVDAVVLRLAGSSVPVLREDLTVAADGGMPLDGLSSWCAERGLSGLGFASGIPGTVAGAVAVNAGAFGRQMSDVLVEADALDSQGKKVCLQSAAMGFSYRHCGAAASGYVLLRFRFRLCLADPETLNRERQESLAFRKARHPDWRRVPCAGSFFRNIEPSSSAGPRQSAGWFLEQAGARGMTEGGARVFERHCNVVVADGPDATATDVLRLSDRMARAVRRRFGIELQREVRLLGTPS